MVGSDTSRCRSWSPVRTETDIGTLLPTGSARSRPGDGYRVSGIEGRRPIDDLSAVARTGGGGRPSGTISPMLQLVGLRKAFADRVLLDDVTWQLNARDRVGLCGPNGA